MPPSKQRKVAVIGAGPVGLIFMRTILKAGHEVVGFELQSKVGGMWNFTAPDNGLGHEKSSDPDGCTNSIYSSVEFNTSKYISVPSDDLPDDSLIPHDEHWMNRELFLNVIERRAQKFNLIPKIKFNVKVIKLEKKVNTWDVIYESNNVNRVETFDFVVCCVGNFRYPVKPQIDNMHVYKGISIHVGEVRLENKIFPNKKVLVIGGGFSGGDMVMSALKYKASKVYWCVSRGGYCNHWMLQKTPENKPLSKPWDIKITTRYYHYDKPDLFKTALESCIVLLKKNADDKFQFPRDRLTVCDASIVNKHLEQGDLELINPIKSMTEKGVLCSDGTTYNDIDVVVCATGYYSRFPMMDDFWPKEEQKKNELYYHILPTNDNMQGLAIAGALDGSTSFQYLYELQSRWLCKFWLTRDYNHGRLFSETEINKMKDAIAKVKASKIEHRPYDFVVDIPSLCDEIAQEINCLPPCYKDLLEKGNLRDVELGIALMIGPFFSMQYRIQGDDSFPDASDVVINLAKDQFGEQFDIMVQDAMQNLDDFYAKHGIGKERHVITSSFKPFQE